MFMAELALRLIWGTLHGERKYGGNANLGKVKRNCELWSCNYWSILGISNPRTLFSNKPDTQQIGRYYRIIGCDLVVIANLCLTSAANASRFRSPPERLFFCPGTPMRVCCDSVRPRLFRMVSIRARRSAVVACRSILRRAWNPPCDVRTPTLVQLVLCCLAVICSVLDW